MFREREIGEFIDKISSKSPTPGGGTVSALLASLATSLSIMVFNLTVSKKNFDDYDEKVKKDILEALDELNKYNTKFLKAMDDDSMAFEKVMEAFRLPKENEEDKKVRSLKIQENYKLALEVPLQLAKCSYKLYDYIYLAVNYGNQNAITDIGVAALSLQSAIEGAVLNVKINASSIKDINYVNVVINECNKYIKDGREKRDEIIKIIEDKIET